MHCPHLLLSPVLLQPGCLRPGCVKSFSHLLQLDRQIDGRTSYRYINHAPRIMRVVPGLWLGAICVFVSVGHQPVSYQTKKTTFISHPQSSATSAPSRQRYVHEAPCRPTKSAAACHYHLRRLRQIGRRVGQEVATRLVLAMVISRLDYCNAALAGLPLATVTPLQRVQNSAARLIFQLSTRELSLRVCYSYRPGYHAWGTLKRPVQLHATYVRGSVLIWRCCDTLCTSGFMDDVIFAHNRERKCVITIGTVPVPWAGHFQC